MKPSAFEYYAPGTLEETLSLLAEHGEDARLLAGGQSLVPLMNLRMARPEVIVDLNGVAGLSYVRQEDGAVAIGAMTRYAEVQESPIVRDKLPMLAEVTAEVGYPAIRNRGTVGGALAHADPVAEWPCMTLALGAEIVAVGPEGRRVIPADRFFVGMFTTALRQGEVLVEARYPLRPRPGGWGFREYARKTGDYAVVAVAVDLTLEKEAVASARMAFANLADRPVRIAEAEEALVGLKAGAEADAAVTDRIAAALQRYATDPDHAERTELAVVLARRAVNDALRSAQR